LLLFVVSRFLLSRCKDKEYFANRKGKEEQIEDIRNIRTEVFWQLKEKNNKNTSRSGGHCVP
jgi:hypothetical protein